MFEPKGFSETIFKNRYSFTENETWEECCERVARQMALAEPPSKQDLYKNKFKEILIDNLFVPGGRILYNSGRTNPQLLNCFVLDPNKDSKEGWGNSAKNMIITSMGGGGCGDDFSDVRPRGSSISDQKGEAPGAVELMKLIDGCAKPVRSGGQRRVALMFSLDLDHPDIEEFLDAKLTKGELTHANVSVRSKHTKEFIEAVQNDTDWELVWKGKYKKTVKARDIWNKIVTNAYNSAEPGFLNWEKVLDESNIWYIEDLVTTNPCFSGDTLIKTSIGYRKISELKDKEVDLYNYKGQIVKGSVWSNGIKSVVDVKFSNGNVIRCTPDHRFMTNDGKTIEASNLRGLRVMPDIELNDINGEFVKLGFIQGDGNLTRLNSQRHKGLEVNIGYKDQDVSCLFDIQYEIDIRTYYINGLNDILKDLQFDAKVLPERTFPKTFNNWNLKQKKDFVRGLYTANGCVIKNGRVSFKGTCFDLIGQLQEFLTSINIQTYITTNKPIEVKFKNGTYLCKESYDLNISSFNSIKIFAKEIGFVQQYKQDRLKEILIKNAPVVMSIKLAGEEEVYDFNLQDETHWGIIQDVVAHNCGEIALSAYDCCCLGHLVLPRFIYNSSIEWSSLADTIRTSVRFLDNVLTVNTYPLPEMKEKSHKLRRIGLGTTGLADTLALLGYRYGSEEGNKFIDELYRFISKIAYEASVMLAIEKGAFPACVPEKHIQSGFIKRMPAKIKSLIKEHGIRNCAILTQAPTGTVSILSGNCSSGIEPMFAPVYERRYWDNNERKTELVFHPLFEQFMNEKKNVSHFIGSHDLSAKDHLEVQKIVQKHVDNAVSKTINLAHDYPIEEMEKLWFEYLPHLKGTTFYRENTRGYIDDKGNVQEPPLKALSLEEGIKRFNEKHLLGSEQSEECPTGICEI